MKPRRSTGLLVEPPTSATGDIAFNLIIFFLVCASVSPDSGRPQSIPRSEKSKQEKKLEHIEVALTRTTVSLNGSPIRQADFPIRMERLLASKTREEDKVVVVKSKPDTPYQHWITVTSLIEAAGGIITIQTEEVITQQIP